jgi:hypothetical protein
MNGLLLAITRSPRQIVPLNGLICPVEDVIKLRENDGQRQEGPISVNRTCAKEILSVGPPEQFAPARHRQSTPYAFSASTVNIWL